MHEQTGKHKRSKEINRLAIAFIKNISTRMNFKISDSIEVEVLDIYSITWSDYRVTSSWKHYNNLQYI